MKTVNAKIYLVCLITLAVTLFGVGEFWSATWLSKWALLFGIGLFALSIWAALKTSLWHWPLMLYAFASLLYLSVWPQHPYLGQLDAVTLLALQKNALVGLAEVVLGVFAFATLAQPAYAIGAHYAMLMLWGLGVARILIMPLHGPGSPVYNGSFFGNPSMGAGLLACLMPAALNMAWKKKQHRWGWPLAWGLTWLAVYRTGASVPWGVLGASTVAFFFALAPRRHKTLILSLTPALAFSLVMVGKHLVPDFFGNSGRFEIWQMAYDWWRSNGSLRWGMGFSTSQLLVPLEQIVTKHYSGNYFLWLHNDWLQLLIEGGLIGFACVLLSVARLLVASWNSAVMFSALVGLMTLGVFNYPLRMPIHALVLCMVAGSAEALQIALRRRRSQVASTAVRTARMPA